MGRLLAGTLVVWAAGATGSLVFRGVIGFVAVIANGMGVPYSTGQWLGSGVLVLIVWLGWGRWWTLGDGDDIPMSYAMLGLAVALTVGALLGWDPLMDAIHLSPDPDPRRA